MTGREPLLWPFLCNPLCIDSIELSVVRFVALKRTMPVVQMSSPESRELSLQVVQLFVIKKNEYFRFLGDKSTRVITHDINYHFSFNLADWSQGTICQLFLWWVGSLKHDTIKLLPIISMSLFVWLSEFSESQAAVEVKLCKQRNCAS